MSTTLGLCKQEVWYFIQVNSGRIVNRIWWCIKSKNRDKCAKCWLRSVINKMNQYFNMTSSHKNANLEMRLKWLAVTWHWTSRSNTMNAEVLYTTIRFKKNTCIGAINKVFQMIFIYSMLRAITRSFCIRAFFSGECLYMSHIIQPACI